MTYHTKTSECIGFFDSILETISKNSLLYKHLVIPLPNFFSLYVLNQWFSTFFYFTVENFDNYAPYFMTWIFFAARLYWFSVPVYQICIQFYEFWCRLGYLSDTPAEKHCLKWQNFFILLITIEENITNRFSFNLHFFRLHSYKFKDFRKIREVNKKWTSRNERFEIEGY